ncbi:MAG: hypothetical protein JOS17DRAFT_778284 [Linnemannia elongata]|nr:MAG: hypothetical protein JOS17DRAFT_778284 [Linnemannia elongata]
MRFSFTSTFVVALTISAVHIRAAAAANAHCTDPQPVNVCCVKFAEVTPNNPVLSAIFGQDYILPGPLAGIGCIYKTSFGCPPLTKEASCVFYNSLLGAVAIPCVVGSSSSSTGTPSFPGLK